MFNFRQVGGEGIGRVRFPCPCWDLGENSMKSMDGLKGSFDLVVFHFAIKGPS